MDVVVNGRHAGIHQGDPVNMNIQNNRERNGQFRVIHENGHAEVQNQPAVRREKTDFSLSSWQKVLFPLILRIVHIVARYIVAIGILWRRLQRKISSNWSLRKLRDLQNNLLSICHPGWCSIKDEIRNHSLEVHRKHNFVKLRYLADKNLRKKPLHIAFAYLEGNKFSYTDIGNLIVWCVAMNISNISVYDFDGKLKKQKNCLEQMISQRLPIEIQESCNIHWDTHTNYCEGEIYDNGFQTSSISVENKKTDQVI